MKFADANTESCMQPQVINFELRACSKTIVACFAGSDLCLAFQIVLQTRPFNLLVEVPIIFVVPMKVKKKTSFVYVRDGWHFFYDAEYALKSRSSFLPLKRCLFSAKVFFLWSTNFEVLRKREIVFIRPVKVELGLLPFFRSWSLQGASSTFWLVNAWQLIDGRRDRITSKSVSIMQKPGFLWQAFPLSSPPFLLPFALPPLRLSMPATQGEHPHL